MTRVVFRGTAPLVFGLIFGLGLAFLVQWVTPIVAFMQARDWQLTQTSTSAVVEGLKIHGTLLKGSQIGFIRSKGGYWREVPFEFAEDTSPGNSKPSGFHSFGRWIWFHKPGIRPYETKITIQHDSNGRVIETSIGPFRVGRAS